MIVFEDRALGRYLGFDEVRRMGHSYGISILISTDAGELTLSLPLFTGGQNEKASVSMSEREPF